MADLSVKFMRFLEDVSLAERRHAERFAREEVTDYVFRQNDALFRAEEDTVRRIVATLESLDVSRYADLGALVTAVDVLVRGIIIDHEEPETIYRVVSRKLQKLRSYVERDAEP